MRSPFLSSLARAFGLAIPLVIALSKGNLGTRWHFDPEPACLRTQAHRRYGHLHQNGNAHESQVRGHRLVLAPGTGMEQALALAAALENRNRTSDRSRDRAACRRAVFAASHDQRDHHTPWSSCSCSDRGTHCESRTTQFPRAAAGMANSGPDPVTGARNDRGSALCGRRTARHFCAG